MSDPTRQLRAVIDDLRRDFEAAMRLSGERRDHALGELDNRDWRASEVYDSLADEHQDEDDPAHDAVHTLGVELDALLKEIHEAWMNAGEKSWRNAVPGAHAVYR